MFPRQYCETRVDGSPCLLLLTDIVPLRGGAPSSEGKGLYRLFATMETRTLTRVSARKSQANRDQTVSHLRVVTTPEDDGRRFGDSVRSVVKDDSPARWKVAVFESSALPRGGPVPDS